MVGAEEPQLVMLVGIQPRSGPTQPSHEIAPGLLAIGGVLVQPLAEQSLDALDGVEIRAVLRESLLQEEANARDSFQRCLRGAVFNMHIRTCSQV